MSCGLLYYHILYCPELHYTVLYFTTMNPTFLSCNVLKSILLYLTVVYFTVLSFTQLVMIIIDQDVEVLEGDDEYELSEKGIEVSIDLETDFKEKIEERVHEKTETDKRYLECPICKKMFKNIRLLRNHEKNGHLRTNKVEDFSGWCPYCDRYVL